MSHTLFADFALACARRLTGVPAEHPCARLHGHTFLVQLRVKGPVDRSTGFVLDFADLQRAWGPIHEALDHRYLNDIPGLENPTSEHLAVWIHSRVAPLIGLPLTVEIRETGGVGCSFPAD